MTVVPAAPAATGSSARLVWADRDLRRLNLSLLGSTVGDGAYATALAVYAFAWGGAGALGAYVAAKLALKALALPFLVAAVDRFPRTTVLVALDLARAALVAVVALLVLVDAPPLPVLVTAGVVGLVGAPYRAVSAALTPSLVSSPRALTAANGVGSTVESVAVLAGPALGGLLLAVTSVPVVVALDVLTFVWSAVLVLGVRRTGRLPAASSPPPRRPGGAWSGFGTLWSDPRLRLVAGLACLQTVVAGACAVFTVVVALQLVDLGPPGVGYLTALVGAGAVAGGLVALGRAGRGSLATDFGAGVLLSTVPPLVVGLVPDPVVAVLAFFVLGLGNPLVDVNLLTMVQRTVPAQALGLVFGALQSATRGAIAVGALLVPLLVGALGPGWGLVALVLPVAAATLACWPALRRLDRTLAPPALLGLVRDQALLAGLPPAAQELVATRLHRLDVPAGTHVIEAGQEGDTFYLIASGRLDAVRDSVRLSTMRAGDCFGEIALLRDVPRTATVVAVDDAVLYALDRPDFLQAVGADPETTARADLLVRTRIDR
ncbi:MFS transporter [Microlunatus spumicola]|uniref:MFS transporter n=1 Tax=Microlunatus spumicola TaxID=81499 RepID=UPI00195DFF3E